MPELVATSLIIFKEISVRKDITLKISPVALLIINSASQTVGTSIRYNPSKVFYTLGIGKVEVG